ncbi:hypothetical protein Glove_216g194 [Diversispora epigaea]|uniref:Uncharacterized protein n=1 Tax=Diversispora epigaea TaxID=1348612 RepID=A0A397IQR1_9GLOM|nr:hypothetical protein Glove_216g194 [Diversispora epigaea]
MDVDLNKAREICNDPRENWNVMRYEVEGVDVSDDWPNNVFGCPNPGDTIKEFPSIHNVFALNPDLTCFYRAKAVDFPKDIDYVLQLSRL